MSNVIANDCANKGNLIDVTNREKVGDGIGNVAPNNVHIDTSKVEMQPVDNTDVVLAFKSRKDNKTRLINEVYQGNKEFNSDKILTLSLRGWIMIKKGIKG